MRIFRGFVFEVRCFTRAEGRLPCFFVIFRFAFFFAIFCLSF